MSSTPGTPKGTDGDAESGDTRRETTPSPAAAQAPSRGWERQPQGSYDAGDSGGWGGPNPGPMTGPIPRIRREPASPSTPQSPTERAAGSADEREHGRQRSAPSEAAASRGDARETARETRDPQEALFQPPTREGTAPVDTPGPPSLPETPETPQSPSTPTTPEPHGTHRAHGPSDHRRREPDTADLPIQAGPATPTGGSFSRYYLPQLLPVTFWLVIAWLVIQELVPLAFFLAGDAPAGSVLLQLFASLVKVAALGCLARVVLEACDRAFHR